MEFIVFCILAMAVIGHFDSQKTRRIMKAEWDKHHRAQQRRTRAANLR